MGHRRNIDPTVGWGRDGGRREAGTYLCGNGDLDLCTLLLLALENGCGVSGDVLETMDNVCVLSRDLEMSSGVGVRMGRVSARWGGHGGVGDGVRECRTLSVHGGVMSGRGGTGKWNAERTRMGANILYSFRGCARYVWGLLPCPMDPDGAGARANCKPMSKRAQDPPLPDSRRLTPASVKPTARDRRRLRRYPPRRPSCPRRH